jgi:iron complex outermembrane receptor protein
MYPTPRRTFDGRFLVCLLALSLTLAASVTAAGQNADGVSIQAQPPTATSPPPAGQEQTPPATAPAQKPEEQEAPPAAPPRLEYEVLVTAPRQEVPLKANPAAITVVPGLAIRSSMPRSIAAEEALHLVPGVKVDNQANGERVHLSIRGQGLLTERGIRGITVLLDGLPLDDPTGFVPDLFDVDWSTVEKIEVFRGAASAFYGGGGSGGVINIETRDGGSSGAAGEASLTGGSYTFVKPFAEVGGTKGSLNYRVSASGNTGDGYRDHTDFHAANLYGKFRWTAGQARLTAIVAGTNFFNQNAEGLNLDWLAEDRRMANPDALTFNEYQRTGRVTGGFTGQVPIAANQELSFSVYDRYTRWRESVPSSVQHREYQTPGATAQYALHTTEKPVANHLTLGTDLSGQWIDEYRLPNLGDAQEGTERLSDERIFQRGIGLYAIDRVELGKEWSVMLGVRHDRIHNELTDNLKADGVDRSGLAVFNKTTGRVGVAWNPLEDFGGYVSWGQGFLPPATEELANNPDALGGFNEHLVPATSEGGEVGIRGVAGNMLSYDFAVFHLNTKNDFGRYRISTRPLETFYGNVGNSRRNGVETSAGWYPNARFTARAAYTWSDFVYTEVTTLVGEYTDTVMPNAPRHQAGVDVEYTASDRWVVGVAVDAQSRSYIDASNQVWIDGFALVHPRVSYRWKTSATRGEVMLTVRNLFGTKYIAFTEPDPDGNSYQPGPTREVFVGLQIQMGK